MDREMIQLKDGVVLAGNKYTNAMLRALDLAKPGFSRNGLVGDDDLSIEWSFIQQQTKKTGVPVSVAYDMSLLREAQRELGLE